MLQVAPKGVADRVLLGLIPSSERSWPTACSCLRPDSGGWLHVHGNVDTGHQAKQWKLDMCGGELEGTNEKAMLGNSNIEISNGSSNGLATSGVASSTATKLSSVKQVAWHSWAKEVAVRMTALLENEHPLAAGLQWRVTTEHIEHVKSYAPHVDHLVVDLQCKPVPVQQPI